MKLSILKPEPSLQKLGKKANSLPFLSGVPQVKTHREQK